MHRSFAAIAALSMIWLAAGPAFAATPADSSAGQPSAQAQGQAQGQAQNQAQDQNKARKTQQQSGKHPESPSKAAPSPSTADQNPFPEDVSRKAAQAQQQGEHPDQAPSASSPEHSPAANANPFPEAVSEKAAQAAAQQNQAPRHQPQYSSSQSSSLTSGGASESSSVPDPARARKDLEVADYYMGSGDYRGAYSRFKDAVAHEPANLAAIYGLAEAARKVGKYDEAARNYHIYLEVAPKGSKAKDARKALRQMAGK